MAMTFNTYTRNDETRKYVKRVKNAGKTLDAFSVLDIDNFVSGCKDLGVWNSMVCWPLRSTQNTGTNTAFSLGGLGTFDGTLVNGPTWGANGVNADNDGNIWGGGKYIEANSPDLRRGSVIQFSKIISDGGGYSSYFGMGGAGMDGILVNVSVGGGRGFGVTKPYLSISNDFNSNGNDFFCQVYRGPSTGTLFSARTIGGSNVTISGDLISLSGTSNLFVFPGSYFPQEGIPEYVIKPLGLEISATLAFNQPLTSNNENLIYSLYKSTLGKGLGLP